MMGRICAEAVGGRNDYLRYVGRSEAERAEQRKAARLSLDTSAHAGSEYQRFMRVLSQVQMHGLAPKHLVLRGTRSHAGLILHVVLTGVGQQRSTVLRWCTSTTYILTCRFDVTCCSGCSLLLQVTRTRG